MQFTLATPQDNKKDSIDITKLKVNLTTGIVEILNKHQDLLGKVEIDVLEVEKNEENKFEKSKYIVQDALVVVSNKGLNTDFSPQTGIYVYAKRILELTPNLSLDEFSRKIEQKSAKLETEKQILNDLILSGGSIEKTKTKIFILEDELEFDKKVFSLIKSVKN